MTSVNQQIHSSGLPKPSCWVLSAEPVPVPGEFVVAISYLSIDPVMRRVIDAAYREPVAIGAVMEAGAVGCVTVSQHPGFAVGEAFRERGAAEGAGQGVSLVRRGGGKGYRRR